MFNLPTYLLIAIFWSIPALGVPPLPSSDGKLSGKSGAQPKPFSDILSSIFETHEQEVGRKTGKGPSSPSFSYTFEAFATQHLRLNLRQRNSSFLAFRNCMYLSKEAISSFNRISEYRPSECFRMLLEYLGHNPHMNPIPLLLRQSAAFYLASAADPEYMFVLKNLPSSAPSVSTGVRDSLSYYHIHAVLLDILKNRYPIEEARKRTSKAIFGVDRLPTTKAQKANIKLPSLISISVAAELADLICNDLLRTSLFNWKYYSPFVNALGKISLPHFHRDHMFFLIKNRNPIIAAIHSHTDSRYVFIDLMKQALDKNISVATFEARIPSVKGVVYASKRLYGTVSSVMVMKDAAELMRIMSHIGMNLNSFEFKLPKEYGVTSDSIIPICNALKNGSYAAFRLLLEIGANPNVLCTPKKPLVHYMPWNQIARPSLVIDDLLAYGADVCVLDEKRVHILDKAMTLPDGHVFRRVFELIREGKCAPPVIAAGKTKPYIHRVFAQEVSDDIRRLVLSQSGESWLGDINDTDIHRDTVLVSVIRSWSRPNAGERDGMWIRVLVEEYGARVMGLEVRSTLSWSRYVGYSQDSIRTIATSPFLTACKLLRDEEKASDLIHFFLDHGADVNEREVKGNRMSCISLVLQNGHVKLAQELMMNEGASLSVVDALTVLHLLSLITRPGYWGSSVSSYWYSQFVVLKACASLDSAMPSELAPLLEAACGVIQTLDQSALRSAVLSWVAH